ncbi:hypothetical protein, partial [Roseobacter weihaiensis]|uniref:hypothetical protein n=1 Tax=Roseobacter weihaiensis TaxID=2763262 RepID=UPI001D0B1A20
FSTNALCASMNLLFFIELSFSRTRDHKWKIPALIDPAFGQQVSFFLLIVLRSRPTERSLCGAQARPVE